MEHRPSLGRVVVAARSFRVGEIISREAPVLVWNTGHWLQLEDKFRDLCIQDQTSILDMYYPPLEETTGMNLSMTQLVGTTPLLRKLVAIANTNSHEYYGYHNIAYTETITPNATPGSGKVAFFAYASKVAHSCRPNSSYSSKTADGMLEYKAIRSISAGEMITFSYIDQLLETPTFIRRKKLMESKAFRCMCERCTSMDFCHSFPCPDCGNLIPRRPIESASEESSWYCEACKKHLDEEHFLAFR
eukprot:scaffold3234_cov166-Amphora_coffeaeformis.AAC.17